MYSSAGASLRESISYEDIRLGIVTAVDWKTIRSAFIRTRGRRTQAEIAKAGDLLQPAISKLESNDSLGPAVGTFVKAVKGLGVPVSEFFRQIEGLPPAVLSAQTRSTPSPRPDDEALSTLTSEDRSNNALLYSVAKSLKPYLDRLHEEGASKRGTHHRHAPKNSDQQTKDGVRSRGAGQGTPQRRVKRKG